MKTKRELRKEILKLRDTLSKEDIREKSQQIVAQVVAQKEFIEANKILLFASYKSEVDTKEIFQASIAMDKRVYFPKVIGKEMEFYQVQQTANLVEGYRGICEPEKNENKRFVLEKEDKLCVIIPGAVYDAAGNRIGYGGGYYDKYLYSLEACLKNETNNKKNNLCKVAIAFACQMVDVGKIEKEAHDIRPDFIITEDKIYTICCAK